jgi:pimeloyl-ACP methyl ester carboxylesterase
MSAHEVSRFADIRNAIQQCCRDLIEYVYSLSEGHKPYFDEVIVVGHSLGSVVAYDVLNEILARERSNGTHLRCAERTSLFLTFGSPLDKIAFIFRSQRPDELMDIREELAAERQPMLLDARSRPRRWVNLSNPYDWIGADIDYFDLQPRDPAHFERVVYNLVEQHVTTDPARAHGHYWRRRAFQQLMLWGAAGCPGRVPLDNAFRPAEAR